MIKTICDICGKEIITAKHYSVDIDCEVISAPYNFVVQDVCEDCANSIYHYIKGLQKEDNK
nr:MAG TPA: antitoxin [Caudoviricetes sp.]